MYACDSVCLQAAAFASLNGVGLALVLPCVQSILADVYSPQRRGLAFGLVLTTGAVGELFSSLCFCWSDVEEDGE